MGFPGGSVVKNPPANAEDRRDSCSIPGPRRSPGGGYGNPLQFPCLENPMGRGDWRATVQSIAELDVAERLRKTHICASFNLVLWQDPGMSHSGDRKVEG